MITFRLGGIYRAEGISCDVRRRRNSSEFALSAESARYIGFADAICFTRYILRMRYVPLCGT